MKTFLWAKARQSNHQITPVLEDNSYDATDVVKLDKALDIENYEKALFVGDFNRILMTV